MPSSHSPPEDDQGAKGRRWAQVRRNNDRGEEEDDHEDEDEDGHGDVGKDGEADMVGVRCNEAEYARLMKCAADGDEDTVDVGAGECDAAAAVDDASSVDARHTAPARSDNVDAALDDVPVTVARRSHSAMCWVRGRSLVARVTATAEEWLSTCPNLRSAPDDSATRDCAARPTTTTPPTRSSSQNRSRHRSRRN